MKEFWKKYKGQLFVTLILMILIAAAPFESYYQRSWTASDLEIPAETEGFAALTEDEDPVLEIREGAESGVVAVVENVTLQKGTYRIQAVTQKAARTRWKSGAAVTSTGTIRKESCWEK